MPLALEPNERLEIVLECDKDKPAPDRPVFYYRYMTARQARQFERKIRGILNAETDGDMPLGGVDELFELATQNLTGWANMRDPESGQDIAFDKDRLDELVTLAEAFELVFSCQSGQSLSSLHKKKSESPSASSTGPSAKDAAVRPDAATSPAS